MLKIEAPKTLDGQVTVDKKDGTSITLDVTWLHYGERELRALLRQPATEAQLINELLSGWKGVADADGALIPPSERAIARLLDQLVPESPKRFFEAYRKALDDAASGN